MRAKRYVKNLIFKLPFPVSKFLRYHALKPFDVFYPQLRADGLAPMSLIRYGGYGTNPELGNQFVEMLKAECGLKEGSEVLDIGSGAGLVDIPIMKVIGSEGKLCGLDIIEESVEWCQKNISSKHPNAEFKHAAIFNASYNPTAKASAKDYKFPYGDSEFDVVLLKSVFTHMRPAEVDNYLSEIARMMKSGGRALITFFVLDPTTRQLIADGKSTFDFSHEFENTMVVNPEIPEDAIAYEIDDLNEMFGKYGLTLENTLWGGWRGGGHENGQEATAQDVLILQKS